MPGDVREQGLREPGPDRPVLRGGRPRHGDLHRTSRALVHDLDVPAHTSEERRHASQGPYRRREPDALGVGATAQVREAFQAECEMRPAFRGADSVDLVHDHRAHAGERGSRRPRREQEVQRLRRGDQDPGRSAHEAAALRLGRVARTDAHVDVVQPGLPLPDPLQRQGEVALDVVVQGLEGRHVEDVHTGPVVAGASVAEQTVESPEEGRQRLAGAGRGGHEEVAAGGDQRPGPLLSRCGHPQGVPEPPRHRGEELRQRVAGVPRRTRPPSPGNGGQEPLPP